MTPYSEEPHEGIQSPTRANLHTQDGPSHNVYFARGSQRLRIPSLLDAPLRSYERFTQQRLHPEQRRNLGLQRVLADAFPLTLPDGSSLSVLKYELMRPRYSEDECRAECKTYATELVLTVCRSEQTAGGAAPPRAVQAAETLTLGPMPLMTATGTFVVAGVEMTVPAKIVRSDGVFFEEHGAGGNRFVRVKLRSTSGTVLTIDLGTDDVLRGRIGQWRFPLTLLFRALGYASDGAILARVLGSERVSLSQVSRRWRRGVLPPMLAADVGDPYWEEFDLDLKARDAFGRSSPAASARLATRGQILDGALIERLKRAGINDVELVRASDSTAIAVLKATIGADRTKYTESALRSLRRRLQRDAVLAVDADPTWLRQRLFRRLRLSGRKQINAHLRVKETALRITEQDLVACVTEIIARRSGTVSQHPVADFTTARILTVGHRLQSAFKKDISTLKHRLTQAPAQSFWSGTTTLGEFGSRRPLRHVWTILKDADSGFAERLDQTNPLAELTHKRRLSAPGLTLDGAGFEVRDVHHSQYGRMCPIETPEGENFGLVTSLACYARVNDLGFVETPYVVVKNGKVLDRIAWLDANQEEAVMIAEANSHVDAHGYFSEDLVLCRQRGVVLLAPKDRVDYMDVAPEQSVSITAGLIPFLEQDDANRVLMGLNMQDPGGAPPHPSDAPGGHGPRGEGRRRFRCHRRRQAQWRRCACDSRRGHRRFSSGRSRRE